MRTVQKIVALTAILIGMIGWAGDSEPFLLDTKDPMVKTGEEVSLSYNSAWVGDNPSSEVVISADGTEIKRTTGEGEFVWSPTTMGKHTLTYTTYINGIAQDEVYAVTVFKDWKYTVEDGKATIVDTTQKSGSVTIPSEIDGCPVVAIEKDVFVNADVDRVTMPSFALTSGGRPGFYEAEFRSMSSFDDSRSIIDNSRGIVLSADMLTADTTDELTMYGYATKMYFEGGVEYGFLAYYDDKASVKIDGKTVIAAASTECRSQTYTIKYDESGWHDIELRGWNNRGEGAAWDSCEGVMWKKGSGAWQKFADPGDGSLFRASGSGAKTLKDLFPDSYESIKNVTLTGTVTEFPMEKFAGCTALESVKLDVNSLELQINGENGWYVDEEGLLRSAKIGKNADSSMMVSVNGAGRLSYRWKASSECYLDEIYDYGYLSVDGAEKGSLVDYKLNGIAIGGHTDWQEVELDISGSGSHSVRWVYAKDDYDDPASIGEDCVWVDDISFRPLTTMGFVVGDATGVAPAPVVEISETKVNLPEYSGFNKAKYSLVGWSDGNTVYAPGGVFEMRATNVTLSAVYEANTIAMPVIESSGVADGGVLDAASATISMSCDEGATIYYTLDGSTPTAASAKYAGEFKAFGLGEVTIKAVALRDNYFDSPVATFTYTRKPYTLAECLNAGGWNVTSEAPAWFRVQGEDAHDGNEALRSGAVGEGGASTLELEVYGDGQLSFWVKTSSHINRGRKYDYLSFKVDGSEYMWLGGSNDWTNVVCDITGSGAHTLTWTFTNNIDNITYGENCAWLDEVMWMGGDKFDITYENLKGATHQNPLAYYEGMTIKFSAPSTVEGYAFAGWTPSEIKASDTGDKIVTANWEWMPQDVVIESSVAGGNRFTVKADWVKTELEQKFGAGKKESFIAKFGDDLASAMTKKTGKRDGSGNELLVWHDYVAGTDPTDINSIFKAKIDIQDGKPVISWEPNLNSAGEERVYTVHGKEKLSDIWHSPIAALDHFFKVDVAMPRKGTVTFNVGGGSSVNPISVRVGQEVGELPTPTRDGYTFLGWFTAQEGGVAVMPETVVTADMTIYARWMEFSPLYCVIDLSAGANAVSYPVTYLSDVPAGGWTDEYKTTKLVLRRIEPGSFKMNGSYDVTITKAFYCGVFEVTQKQYELVTGSKPSYFTGDKLPVEQVSWNAIRGNSNTYNWPTITTVDPNSFIGRLQARTGLNFDLPTEAQWEYACRAGTTTTYSYGDSANGEYMWNSNVSASESHDVGTKLSNPWGLYDMHGNVWEWCLDWRGSLSNGLDPEGVSLGSERINRGGGSSGGANYCTSAYRNYSRPEEGWLNVGFRLVGNLSE